MKKVFKKLKALIKRTNWKKVGLTLGLLAVSSIASVIAGEAGKKLAEAFANKKLNSVGYGMKIYNEAVKAADKDGLTERFNRIWNESHPEFDSFDETQIQQQTDEYYKMFKPYLDDVAKKHAIGGKMLNFDETEPVLLEVIDSKRGICKPHINATVTKVK